MAIAMMLGSAEATDEAGASWKVPWLQCEMFNRPKCLQLATYPYDETYRFCSALELYWINLLNAFIESVTTFCHYR